MRAYVSSQGRPGIGRTFLRRTGRLFIRAAKEVVQLCREFPAFASEKSGVLRRFDIGQCSRQSRFRFLTRRVGQEGVVVGKDCRGSRFPGKEIGVIGEQGILFTG